ncbi:MAG: hypothetical protein H7267_08270 [Sandarakinorhabdus sp.]|nr:hypothetical protein [Sandarakinorhabdus sp.]
MACDYVIPPKGHEKGRACGKPETAKGRCAKHQPPPPTVVVTAVTYHWTPHTVGGGTAVDASFRAECDWGSEQIDKYCSNGPVSGGTPITGKLGNKNGTFTLHHETQPRSNFTFFFNWQGNTMHVYAAGKHTGKTNKKYSLTWFDGSSATIELPASGKATIV